MLAAQDEERVTESKIECLLPMRLTAVIKRILMNVAKLPCAKEGNPDPFARR